MQIIAIDLDGCALEFPEKVNCLAENKNIFVLIYTARPESLRTSTVQELEAKGIRYQALVMGKVRADMYIDDKNCGGLQWPI